MPKEKEFTAASKLEIFQEIERAYASASRDGRKSHGILSNVRRVWNFKHKDHPKLIIKSSSTMTNIWNNGVYSSPKQSMRRLKTPKPYVHDKAADEPQATKQTGSVSEPPATKQAGDGPASAAHNFSLCTTDAETQHQSFPKTSKPRFMKRNHTVKRKSVREVMQELKRNRLS